jgi:uncharacterized membrane protein
MRFSISPLIAILSVVSFFPHVSAIRLLKSTSLATCQDNSSFTASLFDVTFTPDNATVTFDIIGISSISGNVTFSVNIELYGYPVVQKTFSPCDLGLGGMCPMSTGQLNLYSNAPLSQSDVNYIPSFAYGIPDLDATVRVVINTTADPSVSVACLQARVSTDQTVNQKGVVWATAVVAGLGLVTSAVVSGLGHSNTAAHLASYALSLFSYFQAVAIVGFVAVPLPPIVQAWTQNFGWTMGIIDVDFLQNIATWYQKATGGTPATVLNTLTTVSVNVQKRSVATTIKLLEAAHNALYKRGSNQIDADTGTYTVSGINRVAFINNMESTNLFLTGLIFFCLFVVFTVVCVCLFKGFCELAVKAKWMASDKFQDFRNGWQVVLKGIMFRMVLIGFPQMTILCLWEFTQVDSPAEVVLAIFFFFGMAATLSWAAVKVIMIARRSQQMHRNPAYILYSDPTALNKWGFLYVQFRATAYYFIVPVLLYIVVKGMFIAFAQNSGVVQSVSLVLVEAIALIGSSVLKPWMDKSTNVINISICVVNFLNAIFLMVFSNVFNQPHLATGIMGVIFFIVNAVFALVLLIMIVVVSFLSLIRKNPDTRYQPMSDDRASFIKSQTQLTTELDALGATARGDGKSHYKPGLDLDEDDNDSWASESIRRKEASHSSLPTSDGNSGAYRDPPHSPVDPSAPFFPTGQQNYNDQSNTAGATYGDSGNRNYAPLATAPYPRAGSSQSNRGPTFRAANNSSPMGYRSQNNAR